MILRSINAIGIQINQIHFDTETKCVISGKTFIHSGYYHCEIELSVYQLHIMLRHNGHVGRMLQMVIKNDVMGTMKEFPNHVNVEKILGHGIILLADELELSSTKPRRRLDSGQVHHALKLLTIRKLNKLKILKNTTDVVKVTSIPNDRIIYDEKYLKVAYKNFQYYSSLNFNTEEAKSKSGLLNPFVFSIAEQYHYA